MRQISTGQITEEVRRMCIEACTELEGDLLDALKKGLEIEQSPTGKTVLKQILENAEIAKQENKPSCQDTGYVICFLEIGQDVHIVDGSLKEAINEGVRRGYEDGYLRKSVVADPLNRVNTGDNTPAIIYAEIVPGDQLSITIAAKGGGSENMSRIGMLKPADGRQGVKEFVVETVKQAGPNPCPPIVVGVGLGGTFDKAAVMAKQALLRRIGRPSPDAAIAELEQELLMEINATGIGPAGLGGRVTALAVHIIAHPCHIASLPVAVNINCHASRHRKVTL